MAKRFVVFVVFKNERYVSEKEIKNLLPLDKFAEKGLELVKVSVLEV